MLCFSIVSWLRMLGQVQKAGVAKDRLPKTSTNFARESDSEVKIVTT